MTVGDRIREERERARLTRPALAKRSGVPQRTIEAYERGEVADPSWATVVALADALGVSLARMAGKNPQETPPEAVAALVQLEAAQQDVSRALGDLALALGAKRR